MYFAHDVDRPVEGHVACEDGRCPLPPPVNNACMWGYRTFASRHGMFSTKYTKQQRSSYVHTCGPRRWQEQRIARPHASLARRFSLMKSPMGLRRVSRIWEVITVMFDRCKFNEQDAVVPVDRQPSTDREYRRTQKLHRLYNRDCLGSHLLPYCRSSTIL